MRELWSSVELDDKQTELAKDFDKLYYKVGASIPWFGRPMRKYPADLCTYIAMIQHYNPDYIIETGTWYGASAHFMACMCMLQGHGHVITIDPEPKDTLPHPRVSFIKGRSTDPEVLEAVDKIVGDATNNLVFLDSDHSKDNVLAEMEAYGRFVPVGSYMVVEDTNVNGHPVMPEHGPGPMEAVLEFMKRHPEEWSPDDLAFMLFLHTTNPHGYLRRMKVDADLHRP